jgi:hypothetical protein
MDGTLTVESNLNSIVTFGSSSGAVFQMYYHNYGGDGGCPDPSLPLLASHPFLRTSKNCRRHKISLRYTSSIVTTTDRNGQSRNLLVTDNDRGRDDVEDLVDDEEETEIWTPVFPFVVRLSEGCKDTILTCLRQLPDVIFIFWCLYVVGVVMMPHPLNRHGNTPALHELQLRRDLGLLSSMDI